MKAKRDVLCFAAIVAAVALTPAVSTHPFLLQIVIQALIWALLAASWDLLSGYTGQTSFGHAGFFAIGAYAAALSSLQLGAPLAAGIVIAALVTAAIGFLVGFPALRLRGHYLALVTLGFGQIVELGARNLDSITGGTFGLHDFGGFASLARDPASQQLISFVIVLAVSASAVAVMLAVTRFTDAGPSFRAIKEDEVLAQSLGINTTYYKLLAFALSAGMAGLAGALQAYHVRLVAPHISSVGISAMAIGMTVFGGIGTIWGAFLGGLLLSLIIEGLRFVGVVFNLVAVGLVMTVFVIYFPTGLAGLRWRGRKRIQRADLGKARD